MRSLTRLQRGIVKRTQMRQQGQSSIDEGEDAGPGEVHSEPHLPSQTKFLYETAYNTS